MTVLLGLKTRGTAAIIFVPGCFVWAVLHAFSSALFPPWGARTTAIFYPYSILSADLNTFSTALFPPWGTGTIAILVPYFILSAYLKTFSIALFPPWGTGTKAILVPNFILSADWKTNIVAYFLTWTTRRTATATYVPHCIDWTIFLTIAVTVVRVHNRTAYAGSHAFPSALFRIFRTRTTTLVLVHYLIVST